MTNTSHLPPTRRLHTVVRRAGLAALVLLAAACASDRVAVRHTGHVAGHYAAPGPAHDPWGPYIAEAAVMHDVPESWIREVMRVESAGRYDAISSAGAMGLMQLMPATWEELRVRYQLGSDPFQPRDNILAGTAYLREMYDRFGSPGFLAAYNAGPGTFDRYLARQRGLPDETRRYVGMIAPRIDGTVPANRAAPEAYAAARVPANIPPGLRRVVRGPPTQLAYRPPTPPTPPAPPAVIARAPAPVTAPVREPMVVRASLPPSAPPEPPGRFQLISSARAAPALAAPVPPRIGGAWAIQVGAFQSHGPARNAIEQARRAAPELLGGAQVAIASVVTGNGTLVRARLVGLSAAAAVAACQRVEQRGQSCIAVSPDAQS
ncbi:transglycosylase SLT domain-containing protein [Elioraea sp.]|uniref:transglycosylase SLT domain-containing protein n=1 Tax=Elioraea sp. TaxID=2185103 RepID=UPI003F72361B